MSHELAVLYDPCAYYRPWQGRLVACSPRQRSLLNGWLCRRYHLPSPSMPVALDTQWAMRLWRAWWDLPTVAYLLACAKWRDGVLARRDALTLPNAVQAMVRHRFDAAAPIKSARADDDTWLLAWGGAYLQASVPALPEWMAARLSLWFTGLPSVEVSPQPLDEICLKSALAHAAFDPHIRSRLRG